MKKVIFSIGFFALTLTSAFAQDYLSCDFRIPDNKIECPWWPMSCHHNELKEAKTNILVEVHEGETKTGKVTFRKVIINPGSKKEKDNQIIVFEGDYRPEKIKNLHKLDLVTFSTRSGISYKVTKFGPSMDIELRTNVYKLNINLTGDSGYQDSMLLENNSIAVNCQKINKDVYADILTEKQARTIYQSEKESSKARRE